jgi:hypothetical protein
MNFDGRKTFYGWTLGTLLGIEKKNEPDNDYAYSYANVLREVRDQFPEDFI